jgi:hypothetical protein
VTPAGRVVLPTRAGAIRLRVRFAEDVERVIQMSSPEQKLVQDFVIDFLETGPEYIDFVEFADDNYTLADMFQQVLDQITGITERYGDTDGFRK